MDMPLYLVGGPVRDMLLGRTSADLDLVVEGDATRLATEVAQDLAAEVVTHRRFGTATINVDQQRLDLATARHETYSRPGALPKVTPGTINEDLRRRDFTINAMALGLSDPRTGELLDPLAGTADLEQGLIRVMHPGSFRDDATRIFRAVRYEQRLSFRLEPDTQRYLTQALDEGMLATVSADRLRRELGLMLSEEQPLQALMRAGNLGVLRSLYRPLGNASWLNSFSQSRERTQPLVLVAALAYPLTSNEGEAFISRLNMPSRWAAVVRDLTQLKVLQDSLAAPYLSSSSLYHLLEGRSIASISALFHLTPSPVTRERLTNYLEHLRYVRPVLRGKDLVSLGVPQGPKVGQVLRQLKDARLEGRVTTRREEADLALKCLAAREG